MIPSRQFIIAGAIAVASAATGFGTAWQIKSWIEDSEEKDRVEAALENERLVAKTRTRYDQAVIDAVNAGVARSIAIRRDSDSAHTALISLRDATEATLRDAATSHNACLDSSAKLNVVLLECSGKFETLARDADLWQNDALTLQRAWPK